MSSGVPPPLFTLRGHEKGVTALTSCSLSDEPVLVSGAQNGTIILWNLRTFRRESTIKNICSSQIQSLRAVNLCIDGVKHVVLIAQTREEGLKLIDLDKTDFKVLASYPTYNSLFSRGDAIQISDHRAILAYPSCIENHMVTVRLIESKAVTILSGNVQRFEESESRKCTVFDIHIQESTSTKSFLLFVAYEDGCIGLFSFSLDSFKSVPVLNSCGLMIDLIRVFRHFDGEFVSAFDILQTDRDMFSCVSGSPLKEVTFTKCSTDPEAKEDKHIISLKRQGVSAISIRPDHKLVAIACWDTSVCLYSTKTRKLLAVLSNHAKQVQDIHFIDRSRMSQALDTNDPEMDNVDKNEGKYLLCCASLEGTVSISSIY